VCVCAHMENNPFLSNGKAWITKAVEADKARDYETALDCYIRGCEAFFTALKDTRLALPKSGREAIERALIGYINRGEALKKLLQTRRPVGVGVNSSGGGGGGGGGGGSEDCDTVSTHEEESTRLRSGLEAALVPAEKLTIRLKDVKGLEDAKDALWQAVMLPDRFPTVFSGSLRRPWHGILLFGPPGTGKTYLAKAVAGEAGAVLYAVSSSDLVSKWQGESEKLIKALFSLARSTKQRTIVFIDEIDSLCAVRSDGETDSTRRIKTEFLVQMDGIGAKSTGAESSVLVLGATNRPQDLDPAMRRRFEKRIYIPLPSMEAREALFSANGIKNPRAIAEATEGYSGDDIMVLCRTASMIPVTEAKVSTRFIKVADDTPTVKYRTPCATDNNTCSIESPPVGSCAVCGNWHGGITSLPKDSLVVRDLSIGDLQSALKTTPPTVKPSELEVFAEWNGKTTDVEEEEEDRSAQVIESTTLPPDSNVTVESVNPFDDFTE